MPAILVPTRRQVNAEGLLREVHAAEEGERKEFSTLVCVEAEGPLSGSEWK